MSTHFDILIIGSGFSARLAAITLLENKKNVALLEIPETIDDAFYSMIQVFSRQPSTMPLAPMPPTIPLLSGPCEFINSNTMRISNTTISANKILLACGITPIKPILPKNFPTPVYSWDLIQEQILPPMVTIIGAGPIGVSLAFYLRNKSVDVKLVSRNDHVLPKEEKELSAFIEHQLAEVGVKLQLGTIIEKWMPSSNEKIVLATGIKPNTASISFEKSGVFIDDQGLIATMDDLTTSAKHRVWNISGFQSGRYSLDLELYQSRLASNNLLGNFLNIERLNPDPRPVYIPSTPSVASVGLSEKQAQNTYSDARSSVYQWNHPQKGIIKLISRKKSSKLLGAHIAADSASSLILYFNLMIRADISVRELLDEQFYPVLSGASEVLQSLKKLVDV